MGKRHYNHQRVKIHRSYTVEEIAMVFGIHKNTVRHWVKDGLATIDDKRPMLIIGPDLVTFLKDRQIKNKRPCKPGQFYCVRCRTQKYPSGEKAEYKPVTEKFGNLAARCSDCDTIMNQLVSLSKIGQISGKISISFPKELRHITESNKPTVNSDFRKEAANHEKTQPCKRKNQTTIFDFLEGC